MKTFCSYRFARIRPWQVWLAGVLGVASLALILAFASLLALAGIGAVLLVAASAVVVSGVRRILRRAASPIAASRNFLRVKPIQEVRRIEVEVLDPVDEGASEGAPQSSLHSRHEIRF